MKKIAICMSLLLGQAWALSCSTPVTISGPECEYSIPKVALNEEGEAMTLWVSINPENRQETLFAATRDGEKKWSSAALSDAGVDIYIRDLFIDVQGNQFVSWMLRKEDSEGNDLDYYQFAKKGKNQDWSKAVTVLNPDEKLNYPDPAFDSQGNLLLLGYAQSKDPKDTWTTKYSVASVFYSHRNGDVKRTEIAVKNGYSSSQYLLKNREGKVFAWWEDNKSNYSRSKGYQSEKMSMGSWLQSDGSWSAPTTLFVLDDFQSFFDMKEAMNSKGDLAIVWSTSGDLKKVQAATCMDGQWSKVLDLAVADKYFHNLNLKMNDAGHIAAVWKRAEKGNETLYFTEKPAGQPWSPPIALSDPTKEAITTKMSIDDQGNILAIWTVREGRKQVVYAAYKPVNQEWIAPVPLAKGDFGQVKVETNHQGYFVVLWSEFQKRQLSIHGAALSTATKEWSSAAISPPGQDCANFKFTFNKKGQGIIAWRTTWDDEDTFVQVAELIAD